MVVNINIANTIISTIITLEPLDGWTMTKRPTSIEIPHTCNSATPGILQDVRKHLPRTVETERWTKIADKDEPRTMRMELMGVSSIENNSSTTHPTTTSAHIPSCLIDHLELVDLTLVASW